jgi:hypothetical protein
MRPFAACTACCVCLLTLLRDILQLTRFNFLDPRTRARVPAAPIHTRAASMIPASPEMSAAPDTSMLRRYPLPLHDYLYPVKFQYILYDWQKLSVYVYLSILYFLAYPSSNLQAASLADAQRRE